MTREENVIFAAGVIDSGSYIGISERVNTEWMVVLRLRRKDASVIQQIQSTFPGGYLGLKDGMCWINYQGKRVGEILREVYPYLVAKKRHAEIVFDLRGSIEGYKLAIKKEGHRNLTEEEKRFRQDCKERLKKLNNGASMDQETPPPIIMCKSCGQNQVEESGQECLWCAMDKL